MDWGYFLTLLKQYGPVVAVLAVIIFWQAKRIDGLLDRNAQIYESHIKNLWETQQRLLTSVLGPQESSQDSPTVDDIKKVAGATVTTKPPKALPEGGGK